MEIKEKDLKRILNEQREWYQKDTDERFRRSINVLYEQFRHDMKIMGEGWDITKEKIGDMSGRFEGLEEKVDGIFGMVAQNSEDITIMKETIVEMKKDINITKSDISIIKNDLKQKVDRDEFSALEKRVIFLENNFRQPSKVHS